MLTILNSFEHPPPHTHTQKKFKGALAICVQIAIEVQKCLPIMVMEDLPILPPILTFWNVGGNSNA